MMVPLVRGKERSRRADGGWRRKGTRHEKESGTTNTGLLVSLLIFGLGAVIAYVSLMLNQQYPVMMSIGSLVSPTGGQATIAGLRIKHWLVGIALLVFGIGLFFMNSNNTVMKHLGVAMMGAGVFLTLDETDSVACTLTTGVYPCADTI